MREARLWRWILAVFAAITVLVSAHPAAATMSGPCTASVDGHEVTPLSASDPGDAVDVDKNATIRVAAQSTSSINAYRIELEYAGIRWTVAKGQAVNNGWSRDVKVKDYARFGAGLYRLHGVSNGSTSCDGAVLVNVSGNPLASPAGLVGVAFVALGVANAAAMFRRRRGTAVA